MQFKNQPNRQTIFALHIGAWLMMAFFFVGILVSQMPFGDVFVLVIGQFALLATLFYAHTWLVNRYWETGRYMTFLGLGTVVFSLVCTLRFLLNLRFLKKYLEHEGVVIFTPEQRMAVFILATSFIFVVVAVVFQLLMNRYRRERQTLTLLAEKREAELQLLKAQINPHFLFNALHNLYSLTFIKSDKAPVMLLKLSSLLRYVIYDCQLQNIQLDREIAEINNFVDLLEMRSELPLNIHFDIKGNPNAIQIEPMLLIPLVENCFKHADFDTNSAAFCRLILDVSDPNLMVFSTENSFNTNDQQKDQVGGVGLENMRRRLALRYPEHHTFAYGANDSTFSVKLSIKTQ